MISAEDQFVRETSDHRLTVLRDEGTYRHLRCRKPGTRLWGWDVLTWPGYLSITGDLGAWMFCRENDMLLDFFTGPVNTGYWLEKCVAGGPRREVSWDRIRRHIQTDEPSADIQESEEYAALQALDGSQETGEAYRLLAQLEDMAGLVDTWDWELTVPAHHAVLALHAIKWTQQQYLHHRGTNDDENINPTRRIQ